MSAIFRLPVVLALTVVLASAAGAETSPDRIAAGHKLAATTCGACHVVTPDSNEIPIRRPPAPSFAVLMKRPALTEQYLRELLAPNRRELGITHSAAIPRLTDDQIDGIVAYMLSLKGVN